MRKLPGAELARELGISTDELQATFTAYNEGAKAKQDPFGKR